MSQKRHTILKSNYTIREKNRSLKNGNTIYERDYMTTTNLGGFNSGSIPHSENGFKFVHNQKDNAKRRFRNGAWLADENGDTVWTLADVSGRQKKKESSIVINGNKNTLRNFAYYGSCVELFKVSISNIIKFYPGELYVTDAEYQYVNNSGELATLGYGDFDNPVRVLNPFGINISKTSPEKSEDDYNYLRYFSESLNKYEIFNRNKETGAVCFNSFNVSAKKTKRCYSNGEILNKVSLECSDGTIFDINEYYFNDGNIFISDKKNSGKHIRPQEKYIEEFFSEKFSEFEKFLLDTKTNPIYTINIDVPGENEDGTISLTRRQFTLPTVYGWNLNLDSSDYTRYINGVLDVAKAYDDLYSDNLWQNIVHESIKNMDITLNNPSKDEDKTDYNVGIGNIHGLMLAYGRQFDDIKLSIDNIKSGNVVTYDGNDNIPDYFLSDTLGLAGWEVSDVTLGLDETAKVGNLFPGDTGEYSTNELNTLFMRNLKINASHIFRRKGTRHAVEMLLAMFGMSSYEYGKNYYTALPETSKFLSNGKTLQWDDLSDEQKSEFYDYKFDEYVVVAKNKAEDVVDINSLTKIESLNSQIKGDDTIVTLSDDCSNDEHEIYNSIIGLPVRLAYLYKEDGTELKYVIPWFDKAKTYDGKTYFQMYGGWDKIEDAEGYGYVETLKYLHIVDNIGMLSELYQSDLREGEIYYVTNIDDYKSYYKANNQLTPSHYFYLKNVNKPYEYGDYVEDTDGWQMIPENYVDERISHGAQVYQLENIIDDYTGNNPHTGYGRYDDGDKYLERISRVFDGAYDDGKIDADCVYKYGDETYDIDGIREIGFELTDKIVDNVKCWYFTDNYSKNDKLITLDRKYSEIIDAEGETYEIASGYEESRYPEVHYVGKNAVKNKDVAWCSELKTFNLETQDEDSTDEAAANSIINVKNISIEFNKFKYADEKFGEYFKNVILSYLNQVLPSTSILKVKYIGSNTFEACMSTPVITGVSK